MTVDRETLQKMLEVERAMLALSQDEGEFSCRVARRGIEARIERMERLLLDVPIPQHPVRSDDTLTISFSSLPRAARDSYYQLLNTDTKSHPYRHMVEDLTYNGFQTGDYVYHHDFENTLFLVCGVDPRDKMLAVTGCHTSVPDYRYRWIDTDQRRGELYKIVALPGSGSTETPPARRPSRRLVL